jgi:hypothetical protein
VLPDKNWNDRNDLRLEGRPAPSGKTRRACRRRKRWEAPPKAGALLNDYERGLASLPFKLGMGAVTEGFAQAMRDRTNNPARFNRYLAAMADPNTPFPLYLPQLQWTLIREESPEVLDRFLANGIKLNESETADLLKSAEDLESPRKDQILTILAKHGIIGPPVKKSP